MIQNNCRTYGTSSEARCPLTRDVQLWDDQDGAWVTYASGTYNWYTYDEDVYTTDGRNKVYIQTTDQTLDDNTKENSVYYLRCLVTDAWSESSTNPLAAATMTITFNHECDSNALSWTDVGEQSYRLGQGAYKISISWSMSVSNNCPYTVAHYYWDTNLQTWSAFSGANFYSSQSTTLSDTSITINVASADYASYRPEIYHSIKTVITSTYTEPVDIHEEEFRIRFYDECYSNTLSLSNGVADFDYQIGSGNVNKAPVYTEAVAESSCPQTKTCYYFDTSEREWTDCTTLSYLSLSGETLTVNYGAASFTSSHTSPYPEVELLVKIRVEDPRSAQTDYYFEDEFMITFKYSCGLDTLTKSGTDIGLQQLVIGETDTSLSIGFTQQESGCALTYNLDFWDESTQVWYAYTSESFVHTWSSASLRIRVADGNYATYDADPWFNITARLSVTAHLSEQTNNYVEDIFDIYIVDKCRMVYLTAAPTLGSGGSGTLSSPYVVHMWDLLNIPVTTFTADWGYGAIDPNSITRCTTTTTLHYSDGDRTAVPSKNHAINSQSNPTQI